MRNITKLGLFLTMLSFFSVFPKWRVIGVTPIRQDWLLNFCADASINIKFVERGEDKGSNYNFWLS